MVISNGWPASVTWDYDRVELVADCIVHAIGVSLGVVGAIVIVIVVANSARAADMPSILIYTIGLLSMLGFSAAYNTWPISRAKWVLRRFDHSAIYVMIAGTYTAFIGQMRGDFVSIGLLSGVWLTAVVGVTLKLLLPGRFDRLGRHSLPHSWLEWRSSLWAGRNSAPELKHLATGGRRCALFSGRRIPWMAKLAVSECDLAWFWTGRRMLSLFGHSLLCGLGICKVTANGA